MRRTKDDLGSAIIGKRYSDEEEAYKFLENVRWENGIICPHCGVIGEHHLIPALTERKTRIGNVSRRRVWRCVACKKQFSVLVGTIFEDSRIPLSKWLLAIHELNADKNGISSCELGRKLGITQKSAWFMLQRLRWGIANSPLERKLNGTVTIDETYVGADEKNKHADKKTPGTQGRSTKTKTPVFLMVEQDGDVHAETMQIVSSKNIKKVLKARVSPDAIIHSDTFAAYKGLAQEFAGHETVDHNKKEYVRNGVHTNAAEGFFSQLKRSLSGTFHHVSIKHLDRYLSEFNFRYNQRKEKDSERMIQSIKRVHGKRLTYKELIEKVEVIEMKVEVPTSAEPINNANLE